MNPMNLELLAMRVHLAMHAAAYMETRGYAVESIDIKPNESALMTVRPGPRAQHLAGQRVEGARMEARVWNCRVQWRLE